MEKIIKEFIELFGTESIKRFIKNPSFTYTPCAKSSIQFEIEGEHVDAVLEFRFKGKYRTVLDEALSEGNRLVAKRVYMKENESLQDFIEDDEVRNEIKQRGENLLLSVEWHETMLKKMKEIEDKEAKERKEIEDKEAKEKKEREEKEAKEKKEREEKEAKEAKEKKVTSSVVSIVKGEEKDASSSE